MESILTLDRLRQNVAVKELLQAQGQPLMRKTASVPNFSQVLLPLRRIGRSVCFSFHLYTSFTFFIPALSFFFISHLKLFFSELFLLCYRRAHSVIVSTFYTNSPLTTNIFWHSLATFNVVNLHVSSRKCIKGTLTYKAIVNLQITTK